ncbi:uncharacterized protein LOC130689115 [Daphnia carinata]|uniref:uncharacterized protein LOC130689115 n=1 Tax=Daphnia carinata TaxID=120202 RepID=UPI00257BD7C1|nr:uncharacterized protein LOC130689115 [Daphnia carinata]XP_059352360.1 uncharacterized protein LOC130689115 [Daphnia carinata]
MDLIVGYITADASIKEILLQDYQSKEEYFFTTFIKLACSAFNDLLKQNFQTKQENLILIKEKKQEEEEYKKLKKELTDLTRNKQEKPEKCQRCVTQEKDRREFEQKYTKLEKQLKKCAFIINSSLDGDGKVLGRVRDIVSQSVVENNNPQDYDNGVISRTQERLSTCDYPVDMKPVWSLDDDDTSILAPSSPEGNDVETQRFGGPGEDVVVCIPETVPFDHPKQGTTTQKFFKGKDYALSPIMYKKSSSKLGVSRAVSPINVQAITPKKQPKINGEASLDDSIYSPPILTDFGLPSRPSAFLNPTNQRVEETCKKTKSSRRLATESKKCVQPPVTEQQQRTPTSQRHKSLKQTKLTLGRLANDVSPELAIAATVKTRMPTKTIRVSPPANTENKRRRAGKDPENWDCKECYKLFQKAVAAKKIDVRKMPVAMNFCDAHFNRYSYYLNTPPNFWDCGIGKPPRNGHLHPLDASAAEDDDDFM